MLRTAPLLTPLCCHAAYYYRVQVLLLVHLFLCVSVAVDYHYYYGSILINLCRCNCSCLYCRADWDCSTVAPGWNCCATTAPGTSLNWSGCPSDAVSLKGWGRGRSRRDNGHLSFQGFLALTHTHSKEDWGQLSSGGVWVEENKCGFRELILQGARDRCKLIPLRLLMR